MVNNNRCDSDYESVFVTSAEEVLFSVISVHIFGLRYSVPAGCSDCTQFAPFICISTFDFLFLAHVSAYFYYYLYFYCPVRQNKVDMYYQDYTKSFTVIFTKP